MTEYAFTAWFRPRLRAYLHAHRGTRSELARKLEVSGASVHRWDRGLGFPDVEQQAKLAGVFGVAEDEVARLVRESQKRRQRANIELDDARSTVPPDRARRRGKPKAGASWFGRLAGTARIVGDVVGPTTDPRDWDALR
jgi:transcriptional regulator with XRE-family HTH domain